MFFKPLETAWIDWIQLNKARGCSADDLIEILLNHELNPLDIMTEVRQLPQRPDLIQRMNAKFAEEDAWQKQCADEQRAYQAIDNVYLPWAVRTQSTRAHHYLLEDFLNDAECEAIIDRIRIRCRPSTLTRPDEPDKYFRTSQTCDLSLMGDPFLDEIDQRIARYMGFEPNRSEGMQGQYYRVGEEFKTHTDYFQPNTPEFEKFGGIRGQRTWTFMIYLNHVEAGGQTEFPALKLSVTPKKGMAVIWNSIRADGNVNPATAHWAKPIIQGEKFVITKWFRTLGEPPTLYQPPPQREVPVLTREGFTVIRLDEQTHRLLRDCCLAASGNPSLTEPARLAVSSAIERQTAHWLHRPLPIQACGDIIKHTRNATMKLRTAASQTPQISALIQIDQQLNEPWPIHIEDHVCRIHEFTLQPGDVVLFEAARLRCGRPVPLNGEYVVSLQMTLAESTSQP